VIELKAIFKNAEFLGKLGIAPFFLGMPHQDKRYQQSYPQYLGVSAILYKNQRLSVFSGLNTCRWCASARRTVGTANA
jgi:hypothetical protein